MRIRKTDIDSLFGSEPERQESEAAPDLPITVSDLTSQIRGLLEGQFPTVLVQGEISEWTTAASGHRYFTLKDENATIKCVAWRSMHVPDTIRIGMSIVIRGRITVYAPRGVYQLDCKEIRPEGEGELQLAFERLKQKLQEEGLFDPERKQPLPDFPQTIGVVTSGSGAAFHDIVTTLERRMPSVKVVLYPARVQGDGAAEEIVAGIRALNRRKEIDVVIVGRGGGSLEDLWPFNEESVARAIAASSLPVVSAVGHEVDFTIADFVADVRAATPTGAAELVVRDRRDILATVSANGVRIRREVTRLLDQTRDRLRYALSSRGMHLPSTLLQTFDQRVDELLSGSDRMLLHRIARYSEVIALFERSRGMYSPSDRIRTSELLMSELLARASSGSALKIRHTAEQLKRLSASLRALNPENVLKRGYAMVAKEDSIVRSAGQLRSGDRVALRFHDGERGAEIRGPDK